MEFHGNTCILIWLASFRSFDSCAILYNSICYAGFLVPEAVAQICSVKNVFLEILQNSQESTCARVSVLIKFFKKEVFYSEFCEISKSTFFIERFRWLLLWFILVTSSNYCILV